MSEGERLRCAIDGVSWERGGRDLLGQGVREEEEEEEEDVYEANGKGM